MILLSTSKKSVLLFLLLIAIAVASCSRKELKNEWAANAYIDAYGKENGVKLEIAGEFLSGDMQTASISFANIEDLISGGYKEVFTLNFGTYSGSDSVVVTTDLGETEVFACYDGLIFDIDYASDEINRLLQLMDASALTFTQKDRAFTISTKGFQALYEKYFIAPDVTM